MAVWKNLLVSCQEEENLKEVCQLKRRANPEESCLEAVVACRRCPGLGCCGQVGADRVY